MQRHFLFADCMADSLRQRRRTDIVFTVVYAMRKDTELVTILWQRNVCKALPTKRSLLGLWTKHHSAAHFTDFSIIHANVRIDRTFSYRYAIHCIHCVA